MHATVIEQEGARRKAPKYATAGRSAKISVLEKFVDVNLARFAELQTSIEENKERLEHAESLVVEKYGALRVAREYVLVFEVKLEEFVSAKEELKANHDVIKASIQAST